LLPIAHFNVLVLQCEKHRRLDHVHTQREVRYALGLEDRLDLLGCFLEKGQIRTHRTTHPQQAGAAVIVLQPRRVELVVARSAAEIPDVRLAVAGEEGVARELVARPFADHRAGGVADVVLVEGEQRAEAGVRERRARAGEPIIVKPAKIDPLLEVHLRAAGSLQRPVPAVLGVDVVRGRLFRLRFIFRHG